jgi:hypothetical protein
MKLISSKLISSAFAARMAVRRQWREPSAAAATLHAPEESENLILIGAGVHSVVHCY